MMYFLRALLVFSLSATMVGCKPAGVSQTAKPYLTCNSLFNLAGRVCESFKSARGAWPASIDELHAFSDDIVRQDAWGHDFVFTPYDAAKGYGEITSYGADGQAGGTGENADIVIRFPVKANADWNRQQATSIKLPPEMQGQNNWFDAYLN